MLYLHPQRELRHSDLLNKLYGVFPEGCSSKEIQSLIFTVKIKTITENTQRFPLL